MFKKLQNLGYSDITVAHPKELSWIVKSKNKNDLEKRHIHYILPLKRNISFVDYNYEKKNMKFFFFEGRQVWYYSKSIGNRYLFLFLDEHLKAEEEKDFLRNAKEKDMQEFYEKLPAMGTIAVLTDLYEKGEKIYEMLKARINIEQLFDTFKNILEADRSYMRDDYQLEGWMLINFVSMLLYYEIYNILLSKKLLKNYSPKDVLLHLSRISELKVGDQWIKTEIPRKTRLIIEKLSLPII